MKHDKVLKVLEIVFCIIGLVMLGVGIIIFFSGIKKKNTYKTIEAVISEIESYRDVEGDVFHRVYVTYRIPGTGELHETEIGYYSSFMSEGDTIEVMYNPENPKKIVVLNGYWISAGIFAFIGVIFGGLGGAFFLKEVKKYLKQRKLLADGQYIMARIDSVKYNRSYSLNGRHPYNIICNFHDDYKDLTYIYKSDNIWFDPAEIISSRGIEEIKVYIDRNNPKHYYVDTSVLEDKVLDLTWN